MSGVAMPGQTTAQGYGSHHQRERQRWAEAIAQAGGVRCHADECVMPSRWIKVGEAWDLGHDRQRRHRGPEHVRCNRRAGAIASNRTGNPGSRHPRRRPRRRSVGLAEVSVDPRDL